MTPLRLARGASTGETLEEGREEDGEEGGAMLEGEGQLGREGWMRNGRSRLKQEYQKEKEIRDHKH